MILTENDLYLLSQCAISAAFKAGNYISMQTSNEQIIKKKDASLSYATQVFTEVDIKSEQLILDTLAPSMSIYEIGLLTEERPDDNSRIDKDYFWCIDPLDGTLPFIKNQPGFAVSIALVSKSGIPQIGVVYDPSEKKLYSAIKGQGAFCNDEKIIANDRIVPNKKIILFADQSFLEQDNYEKIIDGLKNISNNIANSEFEVVVEGGTVLNSCWILENDNSCFFKFPKTKEGGGCLWDVAAITCIFNETKAFASDIYGNAIDVNRKDSVFMNKNGILFCNSIEIKNEIIKMYESFKN